MHHYFRYKLIHILFRNGNMAMASDDTLEDKDENKKAVIMMLNTLSRNHNQ